MAKFNREAGLWEGDVKPDKPQVWDAERGVWKTDDSIPEVKPVEKPKKVAKKK